METVWHLVKINLKRRKERERAADHSGRYLVPHYHLQSLEESEIKPTQYVLGVVNFYIHFSISTIKLGDSLFGSGRPSICVFGDRLYQMLFCLPSAAKAPQYMEYSPKWVTGMFAVSLMQQPITFNSVSGHAVQSNNTVRSDNWWVPGVRLNLLGKLKKNMLKWTTP